MNKVIKKRNNNYEINPHSIRNNVQITWNGEPISKQEIIDMSVHWNEKQIIFFKKNKKN